MSNDVTNLVRIGATGELLCGTHRYASVEALPELQSPQTCTLLVPSERVLSERLTLPPVSARDAIKAVPFLLEERIAEDVTQLQLSVYRVARGSYHVWAIEHAWLEQQMTALAARGYNVTRVLPDYWLLPWVTDAWTIAEDGVQAWVRFDAWHGCSVPVSQLAQVLALAHQAQPTATPRRCITLGLSDATREALVTTLGADWQWQQHIAYFPRELTLHDTRGRVGNMLSMRAQTQRQWSWSIAQAWRWSAITVCAAGVLALAFTLSEWWCQRATLQQVMTQARLPGAQTLEEVQRRVQRAPVSAPTTLPWLTTLQAITATVRSADGLQLISVESTAQQWQLTVRAYSLSGLTAFKAALVQHGLHVLTTVVQTQPRSLRAVLTLEEVGHA